MQSDSAHVFDAHIVHNVCVCVCGVCVCCFGGREMQEKGAHERASESESESEHARELCVCVCVCNSSECVVQRCILKQDIMPT